MVGRSTCRGGPDRTAIGADTCRRGPGTIETWIFEHLYAVTVNRDGSAGNIEERLPDVSAFLDILPGKSQVIYQLLAVHRWPDYRLNARVYIDI